MNSLNKFSLCDLCDGLTNVYNIYNGGYMANLHNYGKIMEDTIIGKAYTVEFVQIDDPRPTVNYIDNIPSDAILIIGMDLKLQQTVFPFIKPVTAQFGGIMATRAKMQNCKGVVVFGRIRDQEDISKIELPILSYGLSCASSNLVLKPVLVNQPLQIFQSDGKVQTIYPNDIVAISKEGMVHIECTDSDISIEKLTKYIDKSVEVDNLIMDDILSGKKAKESQKSRRAILKDYK